MTDEQIEKALNCCQWTTKKCDECPLNLNTPCSTNLHIAALAYINRLKAEKSALVKEADDNAALAMAQKLRAGRLEETVENVRKETAKEILQYLYCEINREKGAGTLYADFNFGLDTALGKIENIAEEYDVEVEE